MPGLPCNKIAIDHDVRRRRSVKSTRICHVGENHVMADHLAPGQQFGNRGQDPKAMAQALP